MKSSDTVGVTLVNTVINRGIWNGVLNINFGTFNFTPDEEGKAIDLDPVISCRLRMDKKCAEGLRDCLIDLLRQIDQMENAPQLDIEESGEIRLKKPRTKRVEVN